MPIPFPAAGTVDPAGHYSAKNAWLKTPAPTAAYYWDQTTLRQHVGTLISVAGHTLSIRRGQRHDF